MSTAKFDTLQNRAGTKSVPVDTVVESLLREFLEVREGVLYWRKKPSMPVPAGAQVGSVVGGYLRFKFRGRTYANHRVIFFLRNGWWPELVDHKDTDKLNNADDNLRPASRADNKANSRPHNGRSRKGAYRLPSGRYAAVIQRDGKRAYLGVFSTESAAHAAYAKAAIRVHGEFARVA